MQYKATLDVSSLKLQVRARDITEEHVLLHILQVAQNIYNSNMHQVYIRLITIMQNQHAQWVKSKI